MANTQEMRAELNAGGAGDWLGVMSAAYAVIGQLGKVNLVHEEWLSRAQSHDPSASPRLTSHRPSAR